MVPMSNEAKKAQPNQRAEPEVEPERGFPFPEIPHLRDVLVGELAAHGHWVVANVESAGSWPIKAQRCRYRGEDIWIIPLTQECYGGVAIQQRQDLDSAACQKLLMRFLSAVSWVYEQGILLTYGFTGGTFPQPLGRRDQGVVGSIISDFDLSYCPEPNSDRAVLALALMREGRSLGHPGYSFLSFYRVLEVALHNGVERGAWIAAKIPTLKGPSARPAVDTLTASGITDIATHLRRTNRQAMAHAREVPVIDPDDPAETRRLSQEIPIVVELASLAVEEFLGVETRWTVYKKHLYELAGFKKVVGDDIVGRVASGEQIPADTLINVPEINVGMRDRPPAKPLLHLRVVEVQQHGKRLILLYEGDIVSMRIGLNFGDERLDFELLTDVRIRDDGTADGMAAIIEYTKFFNALFGNGQLHVYDAHTSELLGRKDAYMPMNMIYDHKKAEAQLARFSAIERARRELENGGWKVRHTKNWQWTRDKERSWLAGWTQ
jgi:hypothetical protein